jgi:nucleotide-binding universal stress UspA family protein
MEKILVGIDDEAASQIAVDWVIQRAQERPVQVHLYTAFDELFGDPVAAESRLLETAERIRSAAPATPVSTELDDRSIMEGLVEHTAEADLLVIGSHPHRRVRSALTGAFPSGIAVRALCPTVVIPDDWKPTGDNVVLAVADDESSDAATRFAAREALATGVPLEAVHAWEFPVPAMDTVAALVVGPEELHALHRTVLKRVTDQLADRADGLKIIPRLLHGPDGVVLDVVVDGARLVVLGTHRHGPAVGALLGSHVQRLLHHGGTPVAVVPNLAPGDGDGAEASVPAHA